MFRGGENFDQSDFIVKKEVQQGRQEIQGKKGGQQRRMRKE